MVRTRTQQRLCHVVLALTSHVMYVVLHTGLCASVRLRSSRTGGACMFATADIQSVAHIVHGCNSDYKTRVAVLVVALSPKYNGPN